MSASGGQCRRGQQSVRRPRPLFRGRLLGSPWLEGHFSKAAWTARQYAYARAMGRDGVYTPQVVVNGRAEGDGLEPGALAGLISRGERGAGGPSVGFSDGAVRSDRARASRRRRRLARALYSALRRSHDPARRERRSHVALYACGARDGSAWQMARRSREFPGAGGDASLAEAVFVQGSGAGPILAAANGKVPHIHLSVIPAKAGIQRASESLDARFRGHDINAGE